MAYFNFRENALKGTLFIVATPIGNLEDITLRALRILKEVDIIAAEDTRHSQKLLNHYGISKPLISYWGERERVKSEVVLSHLRAGRSVALISDAGTPGISDPGSVLIKKAIDEDIVVVPVPGVSALITALSVSGLRTDEFVFLGFLPPRASERKKTLMELSYEKRTIIFYESPHRLIDTLYDMKEHFGSRMACIIKEITKLYEKAYRGVLLDIIAEIERDKVKGEYVIMVEGRGPEPPSLEEAIKEVRYLIKMGRGRKEAVKTIADTYGIEKEKLYRMSLEK